MRIQKALCFFLVIFGLPNFLSAQTSYGGQPLGLQKQLMANAKSNSIQQVAVRPINSIELIKEDQIKGLNRFAVGEDVNINLDQAEGWSELPNGDQLWRSEITSENALGISLLFKDFRLPEGAKLFVYSPDGQQIKGSYTHLNNKDSGKFMAGIIKGSSAIVEYYEPKDVQGSGYFQIYKAFKVYDPGVFSVNQPSSKGKIEPKDFGEASNCHTNINCPEASEWQDLKKGVARITMVFESAMGFCSGTLMNNVKEDNTPYILSAHHCAEGAANPLYEHWQFDFNYAGADCSNPLTEPSAQSIQGCIFRSGKADSDFLLVQIDEALPGSFDVRYHGWDRSSSVPDTAVMIHHPLGDIMKFSFMADDIRVFNNAINWNTGVVTPTMHHFRTEMIEGAFETGSSGAALINKNGHVVGQLNGGTARCTGSLAYIGRLFQSWTNTTSSDGLEIYLDPDGTGVMTLDAKAIESNPTISISGQVLSVAGVPMENVEVKLEGDMNQSVFTDINGDYQIDNVPVNGNYQVRPSKNSNHFEGISTGDMLVLRREILGIAPLDSPAKFIAADASNNGKVSTGDMLVILRMILGIYTQFPDNTSWRFYTSDFPSGLTGVNPFEEMTTSGALDVADIIAPSESVANLDFVGVKIGDPNNSGNPNE